MGEVSVCSCMSQRQPPPPSCSTVDRDKQTTHSMDRQTDSHVQMNTPQETQTDRKAHTHRQYTQAERPVQVVETDSHMHAQTAR